MKRAAKAPTRPTPRAPVVRFLATFGLLLAVYYALILLPWGDRALYLYLRGNAWLAGAILHGLGQDIHVSDLTIRSGAFAVSTRRGCDAFEPAWFFCAAVLAYPAAWRAKPRILLAGAAAILALNLVRIVSLYYLGRYAPGLFASAHLEIWPALFILAAVALWILWVRSVSRPPTAPRDAST